MPDAFSGARKGSGASGLLRGEPQGPGGFLGRGAVQQWGTRAAWDISRRLSLTSCPPLPHEGHAEARKPDRDTRKESPLWGEGWGPLGSQDARGESCSSSPCRGEHSRLAVLILSACVTLMDSPRAGRDTLSSQPRPPPPDLQSASLEKVGGRSAARTRGAVRAHPMTSALPTGRCPAWGEAGDGADGRDPGLHGPGSLLPR